jgi:hypothetical protein
MIVSKSDLNRWHSISLPVLITFLILLFTDLKRSRLARTPLSNTQRCQHARTNKSSTPLTPERKDRDTTRSLSSQLQSPPTADTSPSFVPRVAWPGAGAGSCWLPVAVGGRPGCGGMPAATATAARLRFVLLLKSDCSADGSDLC